MTSQMRFGSNSCLEFARPRRAGRSKRELSKGENGLAARDEHSPEPARPISGLTTFGYGAFPLRNIATVQACPPRPIWGPKPDPDLAFGCRSVPEMRSTSSRERAAASRPYAGLAAKIRRY